LLVGIRSTAVCFSSIAGIPDGMSRYGVANSVWDLMWKDTAPSASPAVYALSLLCEVSAFRAHSALACLICRSLPTAVFRRCEWRVWRCALSFDSSVCEKIGLKRPSV
jgi:hypothetical protein